MLQKIFFKKTCDFFFSHQLTCFKGKGGEQQKVDFWSGETPSERGSDSLKSNRFKHEITDLSL